MVGLSTLATVLELSVDMMASAMKSYSLLCSGKVVQRERSVMSRSVERNLFSKRKGRLVDYH